MAAPVAGVLFCFERCKSLKKITFLLDSKSKISIFYQVLARSLLKMITIDLLVVSIFGNYFGKFPGLGLSPGPNGSGFFPNAKIGA